MSRRRNKNRQNNNAKTGILVLVIIGLLFSTSNSVNKDEELEAVSDDELVSLVRSEKHVVVAFTQKDNAISEKLEKTVLALREDLVDSLGAWVVRAQNSNMARLYNPLGPNQPSLVYFRHGVPLLYDGEIDEELIVHSFSNSKEPAVRELSDENFEHLTQAATGATTGDWFVMFYTTSCVDCQRLQATWEAVAARLKARMNVARVNMQTGGAATARRFRVHRVPGYVLFRQGKLYHYPLDKMDVASLSTFATDWYKNARAEPVPLPLSPFDDLTQAIADWLMERPWVWQGATALCLVGFVMLVYTRMCGRKEKKVADKRKAK